MGTAGDAVRCHRMSPTRAPEGGSRDSCNRGGRSITPRDPRSPSPAVPPPTRVPEAIGDHSKRSSCPPACGGGRFAGPNPAISTPAASQKWPLASKQFGSRLRQYFSSFARFATGSNIPSAKTFLTHRAVSYGQRAPSGLRLFGAPLAPALHFRRGHHGQTRFPVEHRPTPIAGIGCGSHGDRNCARCKDCEPPVRTLTNPPK